MAGQGRSNLPNLCGGQSESRSPNRQIAILLATLLVITQLQDCTSTENCDLVQCQNGGTCEQISTGSRCLCPAAYTGSLCEFEILCPEISTPVLGGVQYSSAPRLVNTSGVLTDQYTLGTTVIYTCPPGYKTTGVTLRSTCQASGLFMPQPPFECQFVCNASTCPSAEFNHTRYSQCCSLDTRPIGCCRNVSKLLFEDRFHGLTGACRQRLFESLVPCENRLRQCYESLSNYNFSCPDLHGCKARVDDPETSASSTVCLPVGGPGSELCHGTCEGFYCFQRQYYCLPGDCINSQSLSEIALSETRMNCDLEKLFLGVRQCSGTTVNVECFGGAKGSASNVFGNCTSETCPTTINPDRSECCMLQGQPVGCCTPPISKLLSNRFRFISDQCAADVGRQLKPCGSRLVSCLNDPSNYNNTCPDSHGCLVPQEKPHLCEQFVGNGSLWCTSSRCSSTGCVSSRFCMPSSCSTLGQRYRLARSDALLKCDSDFLFSKMPCTSATSTLTCDAVTVHASTQDLCNDVLADEPTAYCTSMTPAKVCCTAGQVSLGCCTDSALAKLKDLRSSISSVTCKSDLLDMLPPAGKLLISSVEFAIGGSPLALMPTFGPSTYTTQDSMDCERWIGQDALSCELMVATDDGEASAKSVIAFCIPASCNGTELAKEIAASEVAFRCSLSDIPCTLKYTKITCESRNVTSEFIVETDSGGGGSGGTQSTVIEAAVGGAVGGLVLLLTLILVIKWRSRRREENSPPSDKLELTNNKGGHINAAFMHT